MCVGGKVYFPYFPTYRKQELIKMGTMEGPEKQHQYRQWKDLFHPSLLFILMLDMLGWVRENTSLSGGLLPSFLQGSSSLIGLLTSSSQQWSLEGGMGEEILATLRSVGCPGNQSCLSSYKAGKKASFFKPCFRFYGAMVSQIPPQLWICEMGLANQHFSVSLHGC